MHTSTCLRDSVLFSYNGQLPTARAAGCGTYLAVVPKTILMKLILMFGDEIIDLIKIRKARLSPARLVSLMQKLIVRNEESLNVASDEPKFALLDLSAKKPVHNYVLS